MLPLSRRAFTSALAASTASAHATQPFDQWLAAAACIWRDIAASPEAIAWDGLKFLKSQ